MNEQVADRHLARDPWIPHAEVGHVVDDLVVPFDLARVGECRERRIGEGLHSRASEEDRIGVYRLVGRDVADAPAARKGRLAVFDDRDRDSRHAELLAEFFDALIEAWRWRGICARCEHQAHCGERARTWLQHWLTPGWGRAAAPAWPGVG